MAAVEAALAGLACLMLIALLLLINVEVAARYFFGGSTLVADEYGGYLMVWMTMLGAVHLLRADQHLSVRGLVERMSPRGRNLAGIAAAVIGLAVSLVLMHATWTLVLASARFGSVSIQPSRTPLVWPQLILPLGYLLLSLAYLEEILRRCFGLEPRRSDAISESIG